MRQRPAIYAKLAFVASSAQGRCAYRPQQRDGVARRARRLWVSCFSLIGYRYRFLGFAVGWPL